MKITLKLLKSNKLRSLAIIILVLFIALITFSLPQLLAYLIDQMILLQSARRLLLICVVMGFLIVVKIIVSYLAQQSIAKLQRKVISPLKNDYVLTVIEVGGCNNQVMESMFAQLDGIASIVSVQTFRLFGALVVAIAALLYLLRIDQRVTLLILILIPLCLIFNSWAQRAKAKYQDKLAEEQTNSNYTFNNLLRNLDLFKMNLLDEYKFDKFKTSLEEEAKEQYKASRMPTIAETISTNFYMIIAIVSIFGYGVGVVKGNITFGHYIAAIIYIKFVFAPIKLLVANRIATTKPIASYKQITEFIESNKQVEKHKQVTFDRIVSIEFNYPKYQDKVRINFKQKLVPGQVYTIQAEAGSGKSLIIRMLLRLQPIDRGDILINNIKIEQVNQRFIWERAFYASQETNVFAGTLIDNILIGSNATSNELWHCIEEYQLHSLTADINWKRKISSPSQLSLAEQKQIQIFRLLLANKEVYVLDHIEAGLDEEWKLKLEQIIADKVENAIVIKVGS